MDSSCNVFTFSDSRLEWKSSNVSVHYWSYYLSQTAAMDSIITADQYEDGTCYAIDDVPKAYENGIVMNYTDGMCGFKYLVANNNPDGYQAYFKVMKDNAQTLLAGAAVALTAILSF